MENQFLGTPDRERLTTKGHPVLSCILFLVGIMQFHAFVKTHKTVHQKEWTVLDITFKIIFKGKNGQLKTEEIPVDNKLMRRSSTFSLPSTFNLKSGNASKKPHEITFPTHKVSKN